MKRAASSRPLHWKEQAAYQDALVAASRRRYPGTTIAAVRLRVAWQAGWNVRRSGGGRTNASHWPDDGRNEAFRRGFDEAGGTWFEVERGDIMPKEPKS